MTSTRMVTSCTSGVLAMSASTAPTSLAPSIQSRASADQRSACSRDTEFGQNVGSVMNAIDVAPTPVDRDQSSLTEWHRHAR